MGTTRHTIRGVGALLALTAATATVAAAATITSFSPQGEVAQVRQAVARFDQDVVNFGDPAAPDPLRIRCDDEAAAKGQGRWTSGREWVYDFADDLPPGVTCQAVPANDFEAVDGSPLRGERRFAFNTGGPQVESVQPQSWQDVEEDQAFALQLSGPATAQSVQDKVWCKLESPGERVPVRIVEGQARDDVLAASGWDDDARAAPQRYWVLQCARRLTPASDMELVFGEGVATPSGLRSSDERRFEYSVREPFAASMSCQRENAHADCIPVLPVVLAFSANISSQDARRVRLRAGDQVFDADLDDDSNVVDRLQFNGPFAAQQTLTLELPADLEDESGRTLTNADSFPMRIKTDREPPLAKFAGGAFGIVERFAEGPDGPALLPLTLRHVQLAQDADRQVGLRDLRLDSSASDASIIRWFTRVQRWDSDWVNRERAASDLGADALPAPIDKRTEYAVESRTISLLHDAADATALQVPSAAGNERPLEIIGVPLAPGFHVLEASSRTLGQSLLDADYGKDRRMHVRTSALVTNLAVHFKLGRENALAWVTTLDDGEPVAGATVQVSTCDGKAVASARTNAQGLARFDDLSPEPRSCQQRDGYIGDFQRAYFVSARAQNRGQEDIAFAWSSWQRGFESWRFNVPTSREAQRDQRAHTLFDRTLLRAGETVHMKHLLRSETMAGFALPKARPDTLVITHVGSGEEHTQPLRWRETASGGLSAESDFSIAPAAKLGRYSVRLAHQGEGQSDQPDLDTGQFRVEEFRLPILQGSIAPEGGGPLVANTELPLQLQVDYVSGGAAADLPVQVSATAQRTTPDWSDWDDFSFAPPADDAQADPGTQVIADKLDTTLDAHGSGRVAIASLPQRPYPQRLALEASYPDPNGELQTLASRQTLWPAAVVAGIRAESWVSSGSEAVLQALALDLDGKPLAGVPLQVHAVQRTTRSTRKRLVGGFYTYDSQTESKDLGTVCSGQSDARGLLHCQAELAQPGEIELVARASDAQGRDAVAATSIWVTRQGELWFGGRDDDRMDVLAESKEYAPGETARLQVRMPFREATALVTVEREGILHQEVVPLSGDDPTVALKVDPAWGPNVYVSVLAVRGRVHDVPWTSFFRWGYKAPRQWWQAWRSDRSDYVAPTALVDLAKPAFRFGMAELRVGSAAHRLDVQVQTDAASYQIRDEATVTISARTPHGRPAAGAEVALAAVDEALLELMPNDSWNLLASMMARRAWGVRTATAQMEIVGRRHYGRKAVAAGGGGGSAKSATRELLDTLLLWQPDITLDADGQAQVQLPLNDALTRFRIVAIADLGADRFGTGQTSIRATQDLQLISGLPPLVREGDRFQAMLTLRNGTDAPMRVEVAPQADLPDLAPQTVDVAAHASRQLHWDVRVPTAPAGAPRESLRWTLQARQVDGDASDRLAVNQRVVPAVPISVRQATLVQLDGSYRLDVAAPAGALPTSGAKQGGVKLDLQPRLASGLPAIADWFARYPYTCLEQNASKAIGMDDAKLWAQVKDGLPSYLDEDGLAHYFPPQAGDAHGGSDTLTAWLLAATDEASRGDPAWRLPKEAEQRMIEGLSDFVAGRIERRFWSPRADLDVRKLAAVEALSRYDAATAQMLGSIRIAPNQWPTSALIDWINVLQRIDGVADQAQRLQQAMQILRARLSVQGTRLIFSTERDDDWWWLMQGGDVNAARLLLTVMDDPAWQDDLGRLVSGFLARQKDGAWNTTTANLWGKLALQAFSRTHEQQAVAGWTRARLGDQSRIVDWADLDADADADDGRAAPESLLLPWPEHGKGTLTVAHEGSGKPWLTLQSLAAVPLQAPFAAGYRVRRTVTPLSQADTSLPEGQYSRGDILRVTLEVTGDADMTWVAVTDPIPAGATILGSGLGRDSALASAGEERDDGWAQPAYEERSFEAFRSYYRYLPKGPMTLQYTLRLNNAGTFALPPTRVEAIYAPEMFGESPNAPVQVVAP